MKNFTAGQARELATTSGRQWIVDRILNKIRRAASRGSVKIAWDFSDSADNMYWVVSELKSNGFTVQGLKESDTIILIKW